jgi:hypothetical protein
MRERAATEHFCADIAASCECGSKGSMTTAAEVTAAAAMTAAATCMPTTTTTTTTASTTSMPTATTPRTIGRAGAAGSCER